MAPRANQCSVGLGRLHGRFRRGDRDPRFRDRFLASRSRREDRPRVQRLRQQQRHLGRGRAWDDGGRVRRRHLEQWGRCRIGRMAKPVDADTSDRHSGLRLCFDDRQRPHLGGRPRRPCHERQFLGRRCQQRDHQCSAVRRRKGRPCRCGCRQLRLRGSDRREPLHSFSFGNEHGRHSRQLLQYGKLCRRGRTRGFDPDHRPRRGI